MVGEGAYPPGVTNDMLDAMEGPDDMWLPEPCCGYCEHFDGDRCTKDWNNMDESYYVPDRDDKSEYDWCEDYGWNGETLEYPRKPVKPVRRENQTDYQWKLAMRYYRQDMIEWQKLMWAIRREEEGE